VTGRKLLALPLAFTGGVILSFAGCTETNDSHCSAKGGDEYCQQKTGLAEGEVFCTDNCGGSYDFDGCLVAEEPPAEGCWLCEGAGSQDCGSVGDGDTTESETTADTDSTDGSETMDTSTTETGPECMSSSECPVGMPLCEDGACVACGDGSTVNCASEYPELPACDAGSGECKLCTVEDAAMCMGETPVCEGFACVGCDEHSECPDSACNMSTGACMDPERVWWVNYSVMGPGTGTMADPYKEFDAAFNNILVGEEGVIYFATPGDHDENFLVPGDRTVALIGRTAMGRIQSTGLPAIDMNANATVFVHEINASGGNNIGVSCAGCSAWITRSRIIGNTLGGIDVTDGGTLRLSNSFVGGDVSDQTVLDIVEGTVEINYSTLLGGGFTAKGIRCVQGGGGSTVRNSIVGTRSGDPEIAGCSMMTMMTSVVETPFQDNTVVGDLDVGWFEDFAMGEFSIDVNDAPSEIGTAATWLNGDPEMDINGDARPNTDGSPDWAGADVPG
jgi:hypothetical protein